MPQWNCGCPNCVRARSGQIPSRKQSSLAFTPDDKNWYLVDAGPEATAQLAIYPDLCPPSKSRQTPLAGVLLTDAELDHTMGLLQLREGAGWKLFATESVLKIIQDRFPVLPILEHFSRPKTIPVDPTQELEFGDLRVQFVPLSDHTPRYHYGRKPEGDSVSALVFKGKKTVVYAPCVGGRSPELEALFSSADVVLVDGTFFHDDELARLGFGSDTALSMGHMPVGCDNGSAKWLSKLPTPLIRYVHINNTNPLLDPKSGERAYIKSLGLDLAEDGWEIEI